MSLPLVRPISPVAGALLVTAGLFHPGRLARWAGEHTLADRLGSDAACGVCVRSRGLSPDGHCGDPPEFLPMSAGIHAWTVGAVGVMTLAVMTAHTGSALIASRHRNRLRAYRHLSRFARGRTSDFRHVGFDRCMRPGFRFFGFRVDLRAIAAQAASRMVQETRIIGRSRRPGTMRRVINFRTQKPARRPPRPAHVGNIECPHSPS
jgi:hypothetical protein